MTIIIGISINKKFRDKIPCKKHRKTRTRTKNKVVKFLLENLCSRLILTLK